MLEAMLASQSQRKVLWLSALQGDCLAVFMVEGKPCGGHSRLILKLARLLLSNASRAFQVVADECVRRSQLKALPDLALARDRHLVMISWHHVKTAGDTGGVGNRPALVKIPSMLGRQPQRAGQSRADLESKT